MLTAKRRIIISDDPMAIAQALWHEYAEQFMTAFAEEISLLKAVKTFVEFIGRPSDILEGSLLSS